MLFIALLLTQEKAILSIGLFALSFWAVAVSLFLCFSVHSTCCGVRATLHCPSLCIGLPSSNNAFPLLPRIGVRVYAICRVIGLCDMQGPLWSQCWLMLLQGGNPIVYTLVVVKDMLWLKKTWTQNLPPPLPVGSPFLKGRDEPVFQPSHSLIFTPL